LYSMDGFLLVFFNFYYVIRVYMFLADQVHWLVHRVHGGLNKCFTRIMVMHFPCVSGAICIAELISVRWKITVFTFLHYLRSTGVSPWFLIFPG